MFTSSSGCFRRLSLHPLSPLSFRHHHHHHIHFTLFRLYSSVIGSVAKPASSANISARINQTPRLLKPITPDIKVTSKPKTYDIPRTVNGYLPVYSDYKHNDSQHWVIIRKVKGNVQNLINDLQEFIPAEKITYRADLNHVIVKGKYRDAIRDIIISKGF